MIVIADRTRRTNADGFILVAALWIIVALATLASIYAFYLNNTKQTFAANDDRVRAEAMISSSFALIAYRLLSTEKENPSNRGRINFRLGSANVTADFVPETTRIDLNAAPKELLAGLFVALGASSEAASVYADRIDEWRSSRGSQDDDAQSRYRDEGLGYGPPQAPFASVSELWLVRDLPHNMIERIIPYVTIFSGKAGIDLMDTTPTVIAALPGMTADRIKDLLNRRLAAPEDEKALRSLLTPLQTQYLSSKGAVTRTTIDINFDNGRRVEAEGVINITDQSRPPYQILYWRDDLDGAPLQGLAGVSP